MEDRMKKEEGQKGYFKEIRKIGLDARESKAWMLSGEMLLKGFGWGVVAFFLGICRLPFSIYPLGVAFLCASDTYVGFSVAGLAAASFFLPIPMWVTLSILALTLFVRILTRLFVDIPVRSREEVGVRGILEHIHGRLFCESICLRMTSSCVAVFSLSLYAIVAGGFRYYDVFGAFFAMVVAPTATFFYASLFGDLPMRAVWIERVRRMAKSLLALSLCLSFDGMDFSGVSLGVASAVASTLILSRKEGLLWGMLTSLLCGILVESSYFAVFPVIAVVSFCLFDFSPYLSAFVSCIIGCVVGILSVGREELLSIFFPLLLGASVYCGFEKLFQRGEIGVLRQGGRSRGCDLSCLEAQNAELDSELYGVCHSVSLFADRLTSLNDQDRLGFEKMRVFAEGSRITAEVFYDVLENIKIRYCEDEKRSVAVRDKVREIGFEADQVRVCGDEDIKIFISGLSPLPEQKRLVYLQKQLGRTLDCTLSLPILSADGGSILLVTKRETCFDVRCGIAQTAKEGESGDAVSMFEDINKKQFYVLINDGMGSGREAAITAEVSAEMLKRLLEVGVPIEKSLRMLNDFLSHGRNGGETESSTTVDLFCLDKFTGCAVFLKSGAAPSYVKRGTNLFKMSGAGLPVGILSAIDAKQIGFDTRDGDIIIQVSDGVTGEEDECLWLLNYLNTSEETDPQVIAEQIKEAAVANGNRDDISVVITKIYQKN